MAHGSKKWIKTATGRVLKSKDRTVKDFWGEVARWDEDWQYGRRYAYSRYSNSEKSICPQCRHVEKPILAERKEWTIRNDELRAEYNKLYGDANAVWVVYRKTRRWFDYKYTRSDGTIKTGYKVIFEGKKPKIDEPIGFGEWSRNKNHVYQWHYTPRARLCFKHERMYELKWDTEFFHIWYPRKHTDMRHREYQEYRSEVKILMQKAKYDEKYYDDICPKKNGWLD